MANDLDIKKGVEHELRWDTGIEHPDINVEVKGGEVILSGTVSAYPQKIEAERAALRVNGVVSVTNNIEVRVQFRRSDKDLHSAIVNAIRWNASIEDAEIKVTVKDSWVTLEGTVHYEYQATKARNITEDILGVIGVTNHIQVLSPILRKSA